MTGSIQATPTQVINNMTSDVLQLSFLSSDAAAMKAGQEVYQHTDGSIKKRTTGTQKPLGILMSDCPIGERGLVRVPFHLVLTATVKTANLNAGVEVKPDGTLDADGYPNYVAAVSGDYVQSLTIKAGLVGAHVRIGILQSAYVKA